MSRKTQVCYSHILNYIDKNICSLEARTFMTDFELAMRNAISIQYPEAELNCCWFHFCQAVKRKGAKIGGFIDFIRNNLTARDIYYKLMCLPLLPAQYIVPAFETLEKRVAAEPVVVASDAYSTFMEYFRSHWIVLVCISICYLFHFGLLMISSNRSRKDLRRFLFATCAHARQVRSSHTTGE